MAVLKLIQFSGEIPRMIPRLLPDMAGQRAENVRLEDGGLTPVRKAKYQATISGFDAGQIKTIYKFMGTWLAWDEVVNAAPGPVAADRLYYTGDGAPKMLVGTTVYPLAVPYTTGALTAAVSGTGAGDVITRLYCYTWVTDFGEESEPCPLSNSVAWQAGMTTTLSGFAATPSGRNITKQRIYRSQSSVSSGTELFLIAERAASTANFSDTVAPADYAEALPSREWTAPPDNLSGLIALPNGMMAGFVGKDLYLCEPYRPHAYPEKYVLTMDYQIVALGAFGTSIVVMTEGNPYVVTGYSPDAMTQEKLEINLPCINPRGVVDLGYSVAYPSYDGLVVVSSSGANVVSQAVMTRVNWLKTSPATFVASQYNGRYFSSYEYLEADGSAQRGTFIIDMTGEAMFIKRASRYADACFYDVTAAALYMLDGTEIYEWDALGEVNEIMTWRSKQFVLQAPASFGCILIEANSSLSAEEEAAQQAARDAIVAQNAITFAKESIGGEINGAAMNVHPVNGDELVRIAPESFTSVSVFAENKLLATISKTNQVVRLPPAKSRYWEIMVNGTTPIAQISLATVAMELNGI